MIKRRDFIKTTAAAGAAAIISPFGTMSAFARDSQYFAVHEFIENNPDAVFIMRTNVDTKFNAEAIKAAGLDFGRTVFTNTDDPIKGIPLDYSYAIKPNLTSRGAWMSGYTVEGTMGVITDANFTEGVIESMKEKGIAASSIKLREVNGTENLTDGGYQAMCDRTGADVQVINERIGDISEDLVEWKDVSDGVFFKRIPYLKPINSPESWFLNISKFKAHSMGLTLCSKNIQGSIVAQYQRHCSSFRAAMNISSDDIQDNVWDTIQANYDRHVADGIPRWDTSGVDSNSGLGMETWASRCLDNNSVTPAGLHVIEGVYGRDGNFVVGPHDGFAQDFMTNVIIFGKNHINVDIIGHWLGGHEPGNFGLFHIAQERGASTYLNPMEIPVYEWKNDGSAILTELTEFDRTPLLTRYLWQTSSEDEYHMLDEPYEYPVTAISSENSFQKPETFALNQNYPNPFNPSTTIQFNLNKGGQVRLEVFNTRGQIVDVLVEGHMHKGSHMAVWNAARRPSGTYFYRLKTNSFIDTKKMMLIR